MENEITSEEFERIWKEMDAIEPLTPIPIINNEESELPGTSPDIHSSTT
tara:strand:+ start:625 stop:771 length:147 start_codon:yes stop_codon:yes gene_type:complete